MTDRTGEAKAVLKALGMPKAQQNDRTANIFLSLLNLPPGVPWAKATASKPLRTYDIMDWIAAHCGVRYAPNSRETIRRKSLHQLMQAGLVLYNPDKPDRAVNSPDNGYQIAPETLALVRLVDTPKWGPALAEFLKVRPGLAKTYAKARKMAQVPVAIPGGKLMLSPGKHSQLIRDIITEFGSRFVPGGFLLYAGDTGDKHAYFDRDLLARLGVVVDDHGKLPDVVIFDKERNWLVLAEAASSHGPVDSKRYVELAELFKDATPGLVYVSAFPDRATMRKYLAEIAWETEVWVVTDPEHMIHFNGSKFLGPYAATDEAPGE